MKLPALIPVILAGLVVCAMLTSTAAYGADDKENLAEARRLFKAGARAYKLGKFDKAVIAFDQAYEVAPRPALLFSSAQALRRQYTIDKKPRYLKRALSLLNTYVDQVPEGGRRLDAVKGIEQLEAKLKELGETSEDSSGGEKATLPTTATIYVESVVAHAVVSIDGGPELVLPTFTEVKPGPHKVRVDAAGYESWEKTVNTFAGKVRSLDPELTELPAYLMFSGDEGVEVVVDGRPVGKTPMVTGVEMPAGTHLVVAGRNGYREYVKQLELKRGQQHTVELDLGLTAQRTTSWVLFGAAGVAAITGAVFAGLSLSKQAEAADIYDSQQQQQRSLTVAELDQYTSALGRRDHFSRAAGISLGVGVVAAITGLLTFVYDQPELYTVNQADAATQTDRQHQTAVDKPAWRITNAGQLGIGLQVKF